jgi:hypothetical protein
MRCRVDEGRKVCSRLGAIWQGGLARVFPGAADTLTPANQVTRGGLDFLASVSRFARFSQRFLYLQRTTKTSGLVVFVLFWSSAHLSGASVIAHPVCVGA